jgi:type IV pilus assembly protein PilC
MIVTYEAIDTNGGSTTDTIEAKDTQEAAQVLRSRGLYVTHIAQQKGSGDRKTTTFRPAEGGSLPLKTLALFTRQMAMLLRAGSGLVPGFMAIKRQMRKPKHVVVLDQIITDLEEGTTLTEALRRWPRTFDPVYTAIVAAGEASGALTEMFERLSVIVGKQRALRNKVIGALTYPALLIVMCIGILGVLLFFVLPRFNQMFIQLGVEAPATTKALLATGDLLRGYWPIVLLTAAAGVTGIVLLVNSDRGKQWLSNIQLAVPILGQLRSRLIQAQIFRTMGMLLESRVGLLDTLELAREATRNRRFQTLFDQLEETVTSGGQPSSAFDAAGIVEPYVCQALRTGEESGKLGGAMTYCADLLDETNTELISAVTRLTEPVILIGMGVLVGGVAISLFMPLFDMTSAMR